MSNEEIAVKLEGHEHEIKSLKHRMEDQEKQAEILNDLVISVKELAFNMQNMTSGQQTMISEQQTMNQRISRLENEPAEKWKTVTKTAVTAVVSAVFGALAMAAITLLTTGGF